MVAAETASLVYIFLKTWVCIEKHGQVSDSTGTDNQPQFVMKHVSLLKCRRRR